MMCSGNGNCREWKSVGLLVARLAIGAIFIYHGYGKLTHGAMFAGAFGKWGFPLPLPTVYFVGAVEFFGGLFVLLGVYTRLAAKLLAITMLIALLAVHWRLGQPFMMWELPLSLLGATAALAGVGGGGWQVRKGDGCNQNKEEKGFGACGCDGAQK